MPELEELNLFIISDNPLPLLPDPVPDALPAVAAAAVALACSVCLAISTALFATCSLFNLC